jgi:tetratricopeptide (TPR) repeat protein
MCGVRAGPRQCEYRTVGCRIALVVVLLVAVPAGALAQPAPDIRRGYELLYQGDHGAAARHFDGLLASRPEDLGVQFGALITRHERLETEIGLAPEFERRVDAFIAGAGRRQKDPEATFYLAQAHMLRASYRFEHNKGMWGAARDGAKAKNYSEAYVKAHPDRADAYLTLGIYNYFVDLAPTFAKVFRVMLFLPSGNRAEGLRQIERAAAGGAIFGSKAQRVLVEIYAQFEGRPADALALAERLHRDHPASDDVAFLLGEVYNSPAIENRARAAAVYQEVIDRRRQDTSPDGAASRASALFALAAVRADQWRLDEAIATLTPAIDAGVAKPDWALPQFLLRRGNYRALMNDAGAEADARRVQSTAALARWHGSAAALLKWISERAGTGEAAIYAALLPANRLAADRQWDAAQRAYDALGARHPNDAQVRLRIAQLHVNRGQPDPAIPALSALGASGRGVPDWVKAGALLYLGRAHDLAGRREQARRAYQRVVDNYENERAAGAARLGLITPYRRPSVAGQPGLIARRPGLDTRRPGL